MSNPVDGRHADGAKHCYEVRYVILVPLTLFGPSAQDIRSTYKILVRDVYEGTKALVGG